MTRVLIVDDNADNLYLLRALLRGHGYDVDEASNGADALVKARAQPPDLVVSDLLMPVVDGYTLLRRWRADERLKAIPFVVYTATYTEPRDEQLALALGASAFIIKPAEPEQLLARIQEAAKNSRPVATPHSVATPVDDGALLAQYNEVLIHKLEQKVQQLEQSNRDLRSEIHERARSEAQAAELSRLLHAVADGTSDAVFVKDRAGKYLFINEATRRVLGKPAEEILGKDDFELFDDLSARAFVANDRHVLESNQVHLAEEPLIAAGVRRTFHAVKAPYRDEHGNVIGIVGISRDITDLKRLEEQLRQSQKMEAVGRLAGGIAHDFNNLLTIISSCSELLIAHDSADAAVREHANAIHSAGERAAALTRQLLGFSRRSMLQPEIVDLNALVADTAKLLKRLIGADIEFTTVLAPNLSRVKVDPSQLDQVLMNLAINARDAMPAGGKLTLETHNVEVTDQTLVRQLDCKPGSYVMLAMTDSGCGMTPEVRARIFDPFFTTKPVGSGTGLGLSMVQGIVQQSGGYIHVYSEPGKGTAFKIYLPAHGEAALKKPEPLPPLESRGTETILLVEDDEGVREVAFASLQLHGYTVVSANDGDEALQIARNHDKPIDLILTDVVMPKLSGSELVRLLQTELPNVKVLFMSGYTEDAVVRNGLLEAAVAFIQKPYTPLSLARKVRSVLDAPSGAKQVRPASRAN